MRSFLIAAAALAALAFPIESAEAQQGRHWRSGSGMHWQGQGGWNRGHWRGNPGWNRHAWRGHWRGNPGWNRHAWRGHWRGDPWRRHRGRSIVFVGGGFGSGFGWGGPGFGWGPDPRFGWGGGCRTLWFDGWGWRCAW